MTSKAEKITEGRLELERYTTKFYALREIESDRAVYASWSEFQQLARGILKDEIDRLENEIEWLRKTVNYYHTGKLRQ